MAIEQHWENWSQIRVGLLRALWDEGLSASVIGQLLQISKNAVVGKVHRLQLAPRRSPIQSRQAGGPATKPVPRRGAPRPVQRPHVLVVQPEPIARVTVPERAPRHHPEPEPTPTTAALNEVPDGPMSRSGHQRACLWPFGDPGTAGFRFCGEDAVLARPYCEQHCCRAYVRLTGQVSATA